ncbi:hypothetical protein L7F22_051735 [Adiantum nelumboides]|nr:hypothetical protein [Adiantum nelumboides]
MSVVGLRVSLKGWGLPYMKVGSRPHEGKDRSVKVVDEESLLEEKGRKAYMHEGRSCWGIEGARLHLIGAEGAQQPEAATKGQLKGQPIEA